MAGILNLHGCCGFFLLLNKLRKVSSSKDLGEWIRDNQATESELWVKIFKKNTEIKSVAWDYVVIGILCWGWIDGVKKSIDDQAYLQRITPRTKRSNWSKRSTEHVLRLISEGGMRESGLMHALAAKADGRWGNAHFVSEMTASFDLLAALDNQRRLKQFFEKINRKSRYVIAYGLTNAKKPDKGDSQNI